MARASDGRLCAVMAARQHRRLTLGQPALHRPVEENERARANGDGDQRPEDQSRDIKQVGHEGEASSESPLLILDDAELGQRDTGGLIECELTGEGLGFEGGEVLLARGHGGGRLLIAWGVEVVARAD